MDLTGEWLRFRGIAAHHIDSFNVFMRSMLPIIMEEFKTTIITKKTLCATHVMQLERYRYPKPYYKDTQGVNRRLTPSDAINTLKITYDSPVVADVVHKVYTTDQESLVLNGIDPLPSRRHSEEWGWLMESVTYKEIVLFRVPTVVGSEWCYTLESPDAVEKDMSWRDVGGYFVLCGNRKILLPQKKMRINVPIIMQDAKDPRRLMCEFRAYHDRRIRSTSTLKLYLHHRSHTGLPIITVAIPFMVKHEQSIGTVFQALGVHTRDEMIRYIVGDVDLSRDQAMKHALGGILSDVDEAVTRQDVMRSIGILSSANTNPLAHEQSAYTRFYTEFLPHIEPNNRTDETLLRRAVLLGFIVRRMLETHLGRRKADDRDDMTYQRLETVGMVLALMVRQQMRLFMKSIAKHVVMRAGAGRSVTLTDVLKTSSPTRKIAYGLMTGKWGVKGPKDDSQKDVVQSLEQNTTLASYAHLNRINTPWDRKSKATRIRALQDSYRGILCCSETPEGAGCGLLLNLALGGWVRIGYDSETPRNCMLGFPGGLLDLTDLSYNNNPRTTLVLINGIPLGYTDKPGEYHAYLRKCRMVGALPFDSSVSWNVHSQTIWVCVDEGAILQPMLVSAKVSELRGRLEKGWRPTFRILIAQGYVEMIDKEEEACIRVAHSTDDSRGPTHEVLDPCLMLGVSASIIPWPHMNPAPRNTYQSAMGKQAIGVEHNIHQPWARKAHRLAYPQRPLVSTKIETYLGLDQEPASQVAVVAIGSASGFNQEDSTVWKREALERGLGTTLVFHGIRATERVRGADNERFIKPDPITVRGMRDGCYDTIGDDGMPKDGNRTIIRQGDVILGMVMETGRIGAHKRGETSLRDRSIISQTEETMQVVSIDVRPSATQQGARVVKILMSAVRVPQVGDKFSSRHGQKGVIGQILPQIDMPFCETTGIVPDVIVNPHGIPSRMTMAQLSESVGGIVAAMAGKRVDATAFGGAKISNLQALMKKYGFHPEGEARMRDGRTGELMECSIFMGLVSYQTLRHMVMDKIHARADGPRRQITRQPTGGRARMGGGRFGEMERDEVICHGAPNFARDRLHLNSDRTRVVVCRNCKILARMAGDASRAQRYSHIVNQTDKYHCDMCDSGSACVEFDMPYAMRMLVGYLEAAHISVGMEVTDNEEDTYVFARNDGVLND